jgi:hypothetical protein
VKRHRVLTYVVLGVIIALIVVACAITQKHGPGVSVHETYVEIYPGTKISSADQKALDAVLENFDKSMYKIKTYDGGKLVKTRGSLEDARIDQTLVADAINASQKGVSDWTLQLGNPYQPKIGNADRTHAYMWPIRIQTPSPSTLSSAEELRVSKRLVSRVTPVLQKYSQQPAVQ